MTTESINPVQAEPTLKKPTTTASTSDTITTATEPTSSTNPAAKEQLFTITVRLVKSFEYRTFKNLILHNISTTMTIKELKELARESKLSICLKLDLGILISNSTNNRFIKPL